MPASPHQRRVAAIRRRKVFELRLRGSTFEDIAQALNMTPAGAFKAYEREFQLVPQVDVRRARREHLAEMERVRARLWTVIQGANVDQALTAVGELMKVKNFEAKIQGAFPPLTVDVDESHGSLLEVVRAILAAHDAAADAASKAIEYAGIAADHIDDSIEVESTEVPANEDTSTADKLRAALTGRNGSRSNGSGEKDD